MKINVKVHLGIQEFQSDSTRATSQRSYTMLGVPTTSWILKAYSQMLSFSTLKMKPISNFFSKYEPHQEAWYTLYF